MPTPKAQPPQSPAQPLRLDADSNGMSMTPEEFDGVDDYDECYRYELVRGVVIVSEMPEDWHAAVADHLNYVVRSYENSARCRAIDATIGNGYIATAESRRLADRVIWAGLGRRPDPRRDIPAIVIEIVPRSKRDRHRDYVEKRQEYREAGVKEYWIIDRFRRQMTVAFADGTERVVAEGETCATPLLPGFELPLGPLLAVADRWDQPPA